MQFFNFEDIINAGNIQTLIEQEFNMKKQKNGNYNCPYRVGSDSQSFTATKNEWYDHVEKRGGNIVQLYAICKYGTSVGLDLQKAQQDLGLLYKLDCVNETKQSKKLEATYQFFDEDGQLAHEELKYRLKDGSKTFSQRIPHPTAKGDYIYSLEGVTLYPYNLANFINKPLVFICEGPKDAENVIKHFKAPATSVVGGAGKWLEDYNKYFRGKSVVILQDNDSAGEKGANTIAMNLINIAKTVKILNVSNKEKGDITDFIEDGGTLEELKSLVAKAKPVKSNQLALDNEINLKKERAKLLNKNPFMNYNTIEKGKKIISIPKNQKELCKEIKDRLLGFPKPLGGSTLFDVEKKTYKTRLIRNATELTTWMNEKIGMNCQIKTGIGFLNKEDIFTALLTQGRVYESISYSPNYPTRDNIYYAHKDLPEPSENYETFNSFINFFNPATDVDRMVLKAFFASPLYFEYGQQRPIFIIDSTGGQGCGKTRLVQFNAMLHGSDIVDDSANNMISVQGAQLKNNPEEILKRILSPEGRKRRIICIDNVIGNFKSPEFASMITESQISGKPAYGRGEESVTNHFVYALTSNTATFDRDIVQRAIFLMLDKPQYSVDWEEESTRFIRENRLQILADINAILKEGATFNIDGIRMSSRFPKFEKNVLLPMSGSIELYDVFLAKDKEHKESSDVEIEHANKIRQLFKKNLIACGVINPDFTNLFIADKVCEAWLKDALGDNLKYYSKGYKSLTYFSKCGKFAEIDSKRTTYKSLYGCYWVGREAKKTDNVNQVIDINSQNQIALMNDFN